MTQKIDDYISEGARKRIRKVIQEVEGNEVFFLGSLNEDGVVVSVRVLARGNDSSVAACLDAALRGTAVIHNHPGGNLTPSDADVEVSSVFTNQGVACYIVDNNADRIYVMAEPFKKPERIPVDSGLMDDFFKPDGVLSQEFRNYEFREEQLHMAQSVRETINDDGIALIEAGTGTGKTFAYLLPAIHFAVANKERVVISTNTINLQEQIVYKDIPFLQNVLDEEFNAVLIKGRSNYICKRKLASAYDGADLFDDKDEEDIIDNLNRWSMKTQDGSLSDLNVEPPRDVWERVSSEAEGCLKMRCPFYKECFFYKARRNAAHSEILVVNHHVLFADINIRMEMGDFSEFLLLPPYAAVVVDEAHNIESSATSYFSKLLSKAAIERVLFRIAHKKKRKKERGILASLEYSVANPDSSLKKRLSALREKTVSLRLSLGDTFDSFSNFFEDFFKGDNQRKHITFSPELLNAIEYKDAVYDNLISLKNTLKGLLSDVQSLQKILENYDFRDKKNKVNRLVELQALSFKIHDLVSVAEAFLVGESRKVVRWLECRRFRLDGVSVLFRSAPIDVSEVLRDSLFEHCGSVVLTSATLSVENDLQFIKSRLGLDIYDGNKKKIESILPSPYDYKNRVYMGIFNDVPDPRAKDFAVSLSELLINTLLLTEGKAFVLCTSYSLLNLISEKIEIPMTLNGIRLFKQGTMNRHLLLRQFREDINSVLIGTDSFWEGVDVEGESLSNVIITRLPFQVPNDPVIEARSELIKKRGGNPFMHYFLPQAIIKFKQGFGRLIRSRNDFGSVLICDPRIVNKAYGARFFRSLPECKRVCGARSDVIGGLCEFYESFNKDESRDQQ